MIEWRSDKTPTRIEVDKTRKGGICLAVDIVSYMMMITQ